MLKLQRIHDIRKMSFIAFEYKEHNTIIWIQRQKSLLAPFGRNMYKQNRGTDSVKQLNKILKL